MRNVLILNMFHVALKRSYIRLLLMEGCAVSL